MPISLPVVLTSFLQASFPLFIKCITIFALARVKSPSASTGSQASAFVQLQLRHQYIPVHSQGLVTCRSSQGSLRHRVNFSARHLSMHLSATKPGLLDVSECLNSFILPPAPARTAEPSQWRIPRDGMRGGCVSMTGGKTRLKTHCTKSRNNPRQESDEPDLQAGRTLNESGVRMESVTNTLIARPN